MSIYRIFNIDLSGNDAFTGFNAPVLDAHSDTSATFVDGNDGDTLVIKGSGLQYENGEIVAGTITKMVHYDSDGTKYASIRNMQFDADALTGLGMYWASSTAQFMRAGDDAINGSAADNVLIGLEGRDVLNGLAGRDTLVGGSGNDRLSGGAGADTFLIYPGAGHDVITDFQSTGPQRRHDWIYADLPDYTIRQRGDDTVIRFDHDTSVTLLDFEKSDLDPSDFSLNIM